MSLATISPRELDAQRQNGQTVELIDVRTPVEFQEVHCSYARNVPLSDLNPRELMQKRTVLADQPLYVICRTGSRGKQACEKFHAAGFSNVVNVEGGTLAWEQAGLPVVRGRKIMSLERQVRIAAGLLVVIGAVLGYFVHPWFIGLSAFVGAGLIFAGVTDTCGMGLLLARMPWNQMRTCASLLLLALAGSVPFAAAAEHTRDTLPAVQKALAEKKAVLLDVRERFEWEDGHLKDAICMPLSQLQKGIPAELAKVAPKGTVIYLHCASGIRCLRAAELLEKQGYAVRPLKAGYNQLLKAGFAPAGK
jgi:rhodanese-related sulfurtransferase